LIGEQGKKKEKKKMVKQIKKDLVVCLVLEFKTSQSTRSDQALQGKARQGQATNDSLQSPKSNYFLNSRIVHADLTSRRESRPKKDRDFSQLTINIFF
jgi:hypothetical protein